MRVLVVEDEIKMASLIRRGLPYAQILENYFRHNSSETDAERRRIILAEAIRRHREMVEPSLFQKKDGRWLLSQMIRLPGGWALKIWSDKTRELHQGAVTESTELSSLSDCAIISFDRAGEFRRANNRAATRNTPVRPARTRSCGHNSHTGASRQKTF